MTGAARLAGAARLLYVTTFVMFFDRFSIAPLLIPIAGDLRVPVSAVAEVATVYFVLYGAMQLVYGTLSDRVGRVRLMRASCLAVAAAGTLSAAAPNLTVLLVARALTAMAICALYPSALTYIGDTFEFRVRQRAVADLMTAVALGTAAATFGAGMLSTYASWRLAFLLPAAAALWLAFALRRLPESLPARSLGGLGTQLRRAALRPWVAFLVLLALPEGAAILGFLTFLAPSLEARGTSAAVAGLTLGAYGIAVLAGTRLVRAAAGLRPWLWIAGGGSCLVLCFALAALWQTVPSILASSALAGLAYGTMHSTFQTWATETAPDVRGTSTALFGTAAFLGAGLAAAGLAGLAGSGAYSQLFWVAAAVTAPTMAAGAIGRWRFPDRGVEPAGGVESAGRGEPAGGAESAGGVEPAGSAEPVSGDPAAGPGPGS